MTALVLTPPALVHATLSSPLQYSHLSWPEFQKLFRLGVEMERKKDGIKVHTEKDAGNTTFTLGHNEV